MKTVPSLFAFQLLKVYLNETQLYTTVETDGSGWVTFNVSFSSVAVNRFKVVYEGKAYARPCSFSFAVLTEAVPVSLYFEVTPNKFEPGQQLTLWARAVNTVTNESLVNLQLQFLDNGQKITTPPPLTNSSGETAIQWNYTTDGEAHALNVTIDPNAVAKNRTMATHGL